MLTPCSSLCISNVYGSVRASAYVFWACDAKAQSTDESPSAEDQFLADPGDLPTPQEPWLAEPGAQWSEYNELQIACYGGSMSACDSIWLDERLLLDSLLSKYGRTCGGRADDREISLANLLCTEAFPGHE